MAREISAARTLQELGDPEEWVLPVEEIERIEAGLTCDHGQPHVGMCQVCGHGKLVPALLQRQLELCAERLGATPDDARQIAATLMAARA